MLSNVYTTCTGPCPSVTSGMAELAARLADTAARFVSLSVDPATDTPERLRAYAEHYGADTCRWTFVTGDEPAVRALLVQGLHLAFERAPEGKAAPGEEVSHDTRLVVVDAAGRVRGYYDGRTQDGLDRVEARVRHLLAE